MPHTYPPLNVEIRTPRLTLAGASDELLTGTNFTRFGTVTSFSWLAPGRRGRGLGREMRAAILQLAFAGLGAREADSDAFMATRRPTAFPVPSATSRGHGTDWDTRRGEPAMIHRWRLTRDAWEGVRRDDIELIGVEECLPVLGIG